MADALAIAALALAAQAKSIAIDTANTHRYGFLWDKVNCAGTRLWDAAGITTNTTNFGHFGSVNANYSNPFDCLYPWSERKLCNYRIAAFLSITADGYDVRDAVTAWEDEEGFSYDPPAGIAVGVYTPEFWYTAIDNSAGRIYGVADKAVVGWLHAEATIGGRWFGTVETIEIDGVIKTVLGCRVGMPANRMPMSTIHAYAENGGMTIDDIYSYDYTTVLAIVEYATMNSQNANGRGCADLYRQGEDKIQAAATGTNVIKVLTASAATCIPGALIDIGTAVGGSQVAYRQIVSSAVDGTTPTITNVTISGEPITVTTDNYWSIHAIANMADADIGSKSGYIGTNGFVNAYYRGQVHHGNMFRYVLGAYREKDTNHIWIAKSRKEAETYDTLDITVHRDTGLSVIRNEAGTSVGGYVSKLGAAAGLAAPPFCIEATGGSNNPVGDYTYALGIDASNTTLIAGGTANNSASCGRFYGFWNYTSVSANWNLSGVPFSKSPKRGA